MGLNPVVDPLSCGDSVAIQVHPQELPAECGVEQDALVNACVACGLLEGQRFHRHTVAGLPARMCGTSDTPTAAAGAGRARPTAGGSGRDRSSCVWGTSLPERQ